MLEQRHPSVQDAQQSSIFLYRPEQPLQTYQKPHAHVPAGQEEPLAPKYEHETELPQLAQPQGS